MKRGLVLFVLVLVLIFSLFGVRFIGYSVQTTQSSVTVGGNVTPSTPTPAPSGGGEAVVVKVSNFTLDVDLIKVLIKQGETKRETIELFNNGDLDLDIEIEIDDLGDFIVISEEDFEIKSKEFKIINLDFFAKEDEIADAYTGRIIVRGDGIERIINVILEIKEKKPLFDLLVNVYPSEILPGEEVNARMRMVNFGDLKNIDVLLYYSIKDFEGNILVFREESLAIDRELNIVRELRVPSDIKFGNYVFYAKINYGDIRATSAEAFNVVEKKFFVDKFFVFFFIIFLILVAIWWLASLFRKERFIFGLKKRKKKGKGGRPKDKASKYRFGPYHDVPKSLHSKVRELE